MMLRRPKASPFCVFSHDRPKKWKSFVAFKRMWPQDRYRTKLQRSAYTYEVYFVLRFDKRSERAEQATNKRWKRTTARTGYPVEKEPPVNTPKWALSDEWKDELRRRQEEMVQVQEAER